MSGPLHMLDTTNVYLQLLGFLCEHTAGREIQEQIVFTFLKTPLGSGL